MHWLKNRNEQSRNFLVSIQYSALQNQKQPLYVCMMEKEAELAVCMQK